jgi:hypothetical protein
MAKTAGQVLSNYLAYESKRSVGGAYDKCQNYMVVLSVRSTSVLTDSGQFDISEISGMFANQGAADAIQRDVAAHGIEHVRKAAEILLGTYFTQCVLG